MLLGRLARGAPRGSAFPRTVSGAAERRFLAKSAKGKNGDARKPGTTSSKADGSPAGGTRPAGAAPTSGGNVSNTRGGGFTKGEMLAARQARKANLAARAPTAASPAAPVAQGVAAGTARSGGGGVAGVAEAAGRRGKWGLGKKLLATSSAGVAILGIVWQLKPDAVRKLLDDSPIDHFAIWCMGKYKEYSSPVKDKLLQDLPLGPGQVQPPVLVLDLEGTLLGTIYTRKNGWRVAKRPGLDAFLKEMAQFYEIVIFTDSTGGLADDWISKMDPHTQYISQRVFRDGTRYIDGKYVKDLSALNRPLQKVVIIDDNPDCISLQPENAIRVKKYSLEDGSDPTADTVLYGLAPFLSALAMQGVADFRDVLRPHIGQDSSAVVADYRSKVNAVRRKEEEAMGKGLGGFVRQMAPSVGGNPAMARGGMITSKDIVGDAPDTLPPGAAAAAATTGGLRQGIDGAAPTPAVPVSETRKGGLWKSLDEGTRERQEDFMRKQEAFQRVMEKRNAREEAREKARKEARSGEKA